ncbi:MAG: PSP1 domain-containing protein [Bacteroidia bacterium]
MSCSGCSSGRGNHTANGVPAGCNNNGSCGVNGGCNKLNVFDWLGNMSLPDGQKPFDIIEVRFKNSRKDFFRNTNNLSFNVGDVVAVEASPGHDIGVVSLTGELVRLQMKKKGLNFDSEEVKKIYRKARQQDVDKWKEAQNLEVSSMYKARTIALRLGLQMKLSDVEYQGDKSKAIFYYTADERVDFRELIKVLADEFKVRIEMRQIGARQEAARLGAIGSCGRELCCSTWLTDFRTVSTSAARYQQLSLNPMKLAGQCGKLKCCLNYELDSYLDALKEFPQVDNKKLQTQKGEAFLQKTDIFKRTMWWSYTTERDVFIALNVERVKEILSLNEKGEKPEDLAVVKEKSALAVKQPDFENVVGQDSLTRFDNKRNNRNRPNRKPGHNNKNAQGPNKPAQNANKPAQQNQNKPQQPKNNPQGNKNTQGNKPQNSNKNNQNRNNQNRNKPRPNNNKGPGNDKPKPNP